MDLSNLTPEQIEQILGGKSWCESFMDGMN